MHIKYYISNHLLTGFYQLIMQDFIIHGPLAATLESNDKSFSRKQSLLHICLIKISFMIYQQHTTSYYSKMLALCKNASIKNQWCDFDFLC